MLSEAQAEARSRIFADMTSRFTTKDVLPDLKANLKVDLSAMEARMTWRIIGAMGLLATITTLLDRVVE